MKNKGITIISLVITIVIILIIAGIGINLSLGENGLFIKAKYAKEQYTNAQSYEEQALNELYDQTSKIIEKSDTNAIQSINFEELFNSLEHIKDSNILTSSGTTPSSENIELEVGNYILISFGKTAEYSPVLSISGLEELKELNESNIFNWEGSPSPAIDYKKGRGAAKTKLYTACLKEPKTLTFSVSASYALENLNAMGRLSIYKFN